jgi:hypothetical protein
VLTPVEMNERLQNKNFDSYDFDNKAHRVTDFNTSDLVNTFVLLKRIAKLLEPVGTVDSANRQRIVVEGTTNILPSSYYAGVNQFNIPNSTVFAPLNNAGVTYVQPVQTGPVDPRWQIIDAARMTNAVGIRNNLVFS